MASSGPATIEPTVRLEVRDSVAWLVLNRPEKANAINSQLASEADAALRDIAQDPAVRVLVVTGAGRHFCAGMDLVSAQPLSEPRPQPLQENPVVRLCASLAAVPIPVIAAVNGAATGGGCEVALCADLRMMAGEAKIALPEIRFGVLPAAGGTQRLPRLIGATAAKRMIWIGSALSAEQALASGLVDEVVPGDALLNEVDRLARTLAERPRYALIAAKRLIGQSMGDLTEGLQLETDVIEAMATPEELAAERRKAAEASDTYKKLFG
jgi:enoyl-CoA hydratase/carnithine racemase